MPTPDEMRAALLEQLAYLVDELEAQRPHLARLPGPLLEGRPYDGAPSLKELYGRMVAAEEARRARLTATPPPPPPADWNAVPLDELLDRLQAARRAVTAALDARPPAEWTRALNTPDDPFALAHGCIQHDAECLREIGYRLHESHLTRRLEDLPK